MRLADFHYDLPQELIATHPTDRRRASRLLHLAGEDIWDRQFADFPNLLRPGDLLVLNDTRVIKARLRGRKDSGGKVQLLIERVVTATTALAHIKASKSPKAGSGIDLPGACRATVERKEDDLYLLSFDTDVAPYLECHGEVPLPPYLGRDAESADDERYQTVYARSDGAVAAPTAGLHFDEEMLGEIRTLGIDHCYVTLHVGAGTFQSLREEDIELNHLHGERVQVGRTSCEMIAGTRAGGGRVIAVGTTTVRALESAAAGGALAPFDGETDLFIVPGFEFRVVDAMLTNFHLPESSLLMLVSAFAGTEQVTSAYRHGVSEKYRFFSYGDAMFVERPHR